MSREPEVWSFPTDPAEFDQDERISFSKLDHKYIAVQDDGTEFEFDASLKRWIPVVDEEDEALIQEYQRSYARHTEEDIPAGPRHGKKRKMDHSTDREDGNGRPRNSNNGNNGSSNNQINNPNKRQATRQPPTPKQNTAIYVTGLPLDVTVDEVAELFSRKCGVIAEEIDSGRPRIKLYTDTQGRFKGDALVVFFKPQSVDMAIMLLDDTDFRMSSSGTSAGRMRIQAADASYKKTSYDSGESRSGGGNDGGNGGTSTSTSNRNNKNSNSSNTSANVHEQRPGGGPAPRRSEQDKAKIIKKTQKLDAKLADWDDDEESGALPYRPEPKNAKWEKVVILRHMFTLGELAQDPAALLDIKEDVREECEKLGAVTNVVLFDLEEEGIVSVRFQEREAAEACVHLMHGRAFDGRTVEAFFATGREKFRKSKNDDGGEDGDGDEM